YGSCKAVDSVNPGGRSSQDFNPFNGIGGDREVQGVVSRLCVQYLYAIDQHQRLFKAPPINAYICLRTEWTPLAKIHTGNVCEQLIQRTGRQCFNLLPVDHVDVPV